MIRGLLAPRSIAIAGASIKKGTAFQIGGSAALQNLISHGFEGEVSIVSRSGNSIPDIPAYSSVADIPTPPDCLMISTPSESVESVMANAISAGVRSFVIVSSGFSESGDEGRKREERLYQLAAKNDVVVLGPNTTGYVNFHDKIALSSTSRLNGSLPPPGCIAVVLQSGALGSAFVDYAADAQIGLSYVISTGNEVCCGISNFVEFLVHDHRTKVIVLYIEGFRRPADFVAAARRAAQSGKPIVVVKLGKTDIGRAAASGHTASMTGANEVHTALFRQLGIITADDITEAMDIASVLSTSRRIGSAAALVSPSGGLGGLVAESLSIKGFNFDKLSNEVTGMIDSVLSSPSEGRNPLDITGTPFNAGGATTRILTAIAKDPAIETVVVATTPLVDAWADELVSGICHIHEMYQKPIIVVWESGEFNSRSRAQLRRRGIPVFAGTKRGANALAAVLAKRACWSPDMINPGTKLFLPRRGILDEADSKALLRPYLGFALPVEVVVESLEIRELIGAAKKMEFPVVLKGLVEDVAHKSDRGFVSLGIVDRTALEEAAIKQIEAARATGARLRGFIVAEHVVAGAEVIVGIVRDPEFGFVLTFGAGGVFTEIMSDTSSRLIPLSRVELREMIDECKIGRILDGARGHPALDIDAVIETMERVSEAAFAIGNELDGIEINPLAVLTRGAGVRALDLKIFSRKDAT